MHYVCLLVCVVTLVLGEELKDKYKGYLIPPLPEKTVLSTTTSKLALLIVWLDRFNSEFMEFRRRELQKFLERLSSMCTFIFC